MKYEPTSKANVEKFKKKVESFRPGTIQGKEVVIIGIKLSITDLFFLMIKSSIAFLPMFLVVFLIFVLISL